MLLSSHCIQSLVFHTLLKDLFQLCQIWLLFNALKLRKNDLLKTEQENTKKTERIYSDNMKCHMTSNNSLMTSSRIQPKTLFNLR